MTKIFQSAKAKLLFVISLLLVVTTFTGYKLYSTEQIIRASLEARDEINIKEEKISALLTWIDKINAIFAEVLLGEAQENELYLQTKLLSSEAVFLISGLGQDGELILQDINYTEALLKKTNPSPQKLLEAHKSIVSADERIRSLDKIWAKKLDKIKEDVRGKISSPQRSLLLLITCFSLLLAIITLAINDIFLPLNKISQLLLKAGNGEKFEEYEAMAIRNDEIGQAALALNNLFKKIATMVNDLEISNKGHLRKIKAIEASKGGIGITDPKGNLIFANQALFEIHGISKEESDRYLQKPSMLLYKQEDRDLFLKTILPLVRQQGYWQGESYFTGHDGKGRYGDFSLTLLSDGSMVGTVIDITSRKVTEREKEEVEALFMQAQKMEAIGRLTGGIAHDFNNMLTIVQGNLELLQNTAIQKAPKAQYFVDAALRAVKRSSELTSHMLSFSRKQFLLPKNTPINRFLPEASLLLTRAVGEDVELVLNLSENVASVYVDPMQLETAMLNLVINAKDAMDTGGMIIVSTENIDHAEEFKEGQFSIPAGKYVRIGVEDTGHGISDELISKIFEPFFTTKAIGKGTGLGLSMVYGFVKQSGGHIAVQSAPGTGTRIDLYFPQHIHTEEEQTYNAQIPEVSVLTQRQGKILIAEDETDLLELNKNLLTSLGYNVLCAANGEQALTLLKDNIDIDLILSDIVMPGRVSGRDLASEARRMRSDIKVLLVSGYTNDLDDFMPEDDGPNFLAKPYTQARLATEINLMMTAGTTGSVGL